MSTKQARKTARRKARQEAALASFKAKQTDPEVIKRVARFEFRFLRERSKQLIVENFSK